MEQNARMPVVKYCPICNSEDTELYLEGDDDLHEESIGSSRTKLSHGRILRCRACGSCFRSLRPEPEQLARLYQSADDTVYESEILNRRRTAQRQYRIVERQRSRPGIVIDVGCGSGIFLHLMAERGWTVHGVEPAASQCARARCLLPETASIHEAVLDEATLPCNADVVTLWDVLEHVPHPSEFLGKCAALLSPGGLVILNVPRIDSIPSKLLRSRWPLLLAEHLNYFSIDGLRAAGRRSGMALVATARRPVTFSLDYICFRLSQHGLPGIGVLRNALSSLKIQDWSVPLFTGEIVAIFTKS